MKNLITKIIDFLGKALSETNTTPSFIRVASGWIVFLFVLVLAFGFVYTIFNHKDIIIAYAGILSALITTVIGLKVWQKDKENGVQ